MAMTASLDGPRGSPTATSRPSLISKVVDRLIEARERQAQREIAEHLLALDDAALEAHGLDRVTLNATLKR